MSIAVVDTNVLAVANLKASQAGPACVVTCIERLQEVRDGGAALVDEGHLIIGEYRTYCHPSGQPGAGDRFFQWLLQACRRVAIMPHPDREFVEFPDDPDLAGFDRSDRKFVAVAVASRDDPPVLNATDSDWWHYREAFDRCGVPVEFLCPELMPGR